MDIYYIIDLPDIVIGLQFDPEDRKIRDAGKHHNHTGDGKPRRRKTAYGNNNRYRNKRPYKRGYRVHENGICRREHRNDGRTDKRTACRKRNSNETAKSGRRYKVRYHRKNHDRQQPDRDDRNDTDGISREEDRHADQHRDKDGKRERSGNGRKKNAQVRSA